MHAPHVGQLVAVRVGLAADGDERGGARAQGHHSSGGPAVRQAMSRAMLAVVRARRRAQDEPPRGTCFPRGRGAGASVPAPRTERYAVTMSVESGDAPTPNNVSKMSARYHRQYLDLSTQPVSCVYGQRSTVGASPRTKAQASTGRAVREHRSLIKRAPYFMRRP